MAKKFSELTKNFSPERKAKIEEEVQRELANMPESSANDIITTIKVVDVRDFCGFCKIESGHLFELIDESDISYGNNGDTLIGPKRMAQFLKGLDVTMPDGFDDVWFSIGC
jgi:hypothetical protein